MTLLRFEWGDATAPLRSVLDAGGLLAIPTESSYALAVDPRRADAVAVVFAVKGRAAGMPLPVVVADLDQAAALGVDLDDPGLVRVARRWPAPLSVLARLHRPLPAAAGSDRLAIRVPDHERLRALLAELGTGLTATSANRSGEPALCDPEDTARLLEERAPGAAALVDDGVLPGGPPSTMVSWGDGVFLVRRRGRYDVEQLGTFRDEEFSATNVEITVDNSRG